MKITFLLTCLLCLSLAGFASSADTTIKIPLFRQGFHDKVDNEQALTDKMDGKKDDFLHVSKNDEVNLHVTDAFFRKIDDLQLWVETNQNIPTNNDKVRYLRLIENLVRSFRNNWKSHDIKPVEFPEVYNTFQTILKELPEKKSMLPHIQAAPYEVAKLNAAVFFDSKDYLEAQKIVYLKYATLHPENILKTIMHLPASLLPIVLL